MTKSRDLNFKRGYSLCILYIGINVRVKEIARDVIKAEAEQKDVAYKYYPNSIEEYRYLLSLSNKTGSRTGLDKKKKNAEAGIKFLQYAKSQKKFMGELEMRDPVTYKRVIIYSDPSILKIPFREKARFNDIGIPADQISRSK
jgi:hypothetical protein